MRFVSRSTQITSDGGSWRSKKRESTPIRNGRGACSTSARPSGHRGIYGHCHLNGNIIMDMASATAVKTSGLKEWTNNFCSVRAQSSTSKQLSGPKLIKRLRNLAPLLGRGKSSGWVRITLSAGESWTNIRGRWGDGNGTSSRKWEMYLQNGNKKDIVLQEMGCEPQLQHD